MSPAPQTELRSHLHWCPHDPNSGTSWPCQRAGQSAWGCSLSWPVGPFCGAPMSPQSPRRPFLPSCCWGSGNWDSPSGTKPAPGRHPPRLRSHLAGGAGFGALSPQALMAKVVPAPRLCWRRCLLRAPHGGGPAETRKQLLWRQCLLRHLCCHRETRRPSPPPIP